MKNLTKILVVFALLVGGYAVSQEGNNESSANVENDSVVNAENLSKDDMVSNSNTMLSEMRTTLQETQELLDRTRDEEGDILTLNCINKNLAGIKGFVKIGEQQSEKLAEKDDRRALENSYKLIVLASMKVQELGEEARNCIGEGQRFADQTEVERREDDDIADVEVIEADDDRMDDEVVRDREPELTPFQ